MADETVRVLVRCRPFNNREKNLGCKNVIDVKSDVGMVSIKKPDGSSEPPKNFTFDATYDMNSNSQMIYEEMGFPLVEAVLQGFNGTVFAYGQTGCGKSFTMEGIPNPPQHRGITPRSFEHIFQEVAVRENTKFLVRASYLEIYNEQVRDLLSSNVNQKLDLREDPDRGVYVKDLTLHEVRDTAGIIGLMAKGTSNRSVGATAMNADSSRSHSVFTCWVEMCTTSADGTDSIKAGKLNLVDLAGSERQSKTQAEGARLKEATKINLSLSALGNVISALVDGKSKHIPYRDSKLTRLLQDSLGGNTKTLMIAAISPADNNYDETLSTLRYANRAKNIKNKAKINEDPKDALLREYQEEIKKLKALLAGDGIDLDALKAVSAPQPGNTKKHAIEPSQPDQSVLDRLEAEKKAELAEIEIRLKKDYDAKIAALQEKLLDPNADAEELVELEQEFAAVTEDYEQKKARAEAEVEAQVKTVSTPTKEKQEDSMIRTNQHPVTVIGPDGTPVVSLLGPNGIHIKATIGADSQLHPVVGHDGKPVQILGPDGNPAKELSAKKSLNNSGQKSTTENARLVIRFVPTTVIGQNGEPQAALVGPDGRAVEARVNDTGQLEPVTGDDGQFVYIMGPEGSEPAKAHAVDEAVPVIGPDGELSVSVMTSAGTPLKAQLGDDGFLKPALDTKGRARPLLGPDGKRAREVLAVEPILESEVHASLAILSHAHNSLDVVAICECEGAPVQIDVEKGELVVKSDSSGRLVPVRDGNSATRIYTEHEPVYLFDPSDNSKPGIIVATALPNGNYVRAISKEDGNLEPKKGAQTIKVSSGKPLSVISRVGPDGVDELLNAVVIVGKGGELKPALQTSEKQIVHVEVGPTGYLEPIRERGSNKYLPFKMKSHYRIYRPETRGVVVLTSQGKVEICISSTGSNGMVKATIKNGLLSPSSESALVDAEEVFWAKMAAVAVVPKLTAVIGPNGTPVPAILSPGGQPVEAQVTASGRIHAVRDRKGNLKIIKGPNGSVAPELAPPSGALHVVATEDNGVAVAVCGADGDFVAAEVGDSGLVEAAMDPSGWPTALPGAKSVKESTTVDESLVPGGSNAAQEEHEVVIVTGKDEQAIPAIVAADGTRLRTEVGPNGNLVPMVDPDTGLPVVLDVESETSVNVLQAIVEEQEPVDSSDPLFQGKVDEAVAARLAELERKFASTPTSDKSKEELKEQLKSKKSRAEQKRRERLKLLKAAASDDDVLLEEIYNNAADQVDEQRAKFKKAKELLKASRAETQDLQEEFEREREDLNDTIRAQDKQLALLEAIIDKVMPVIRRDCNYYNLDKIKAHATWDDDRQVWLMPKLQLDQGNGLANLSGAPGVRNSKGKLHPNSAPMSDHRDQALDDKIRARLSRASDSQYFQTSGSGSSERLLANLDRRSEEVAAQMDSRLARIARGGMQKTSLRSQQLLEQGRSARNGSASSIGSQSNSPRLLTRRANGYTANDWLQ